MSKSPSKISNIATSSLDKLPESEFDSIIDPKIHSDLENAANGDILQDPGTPNFSSNSMPPISPITPLIGNNFVRLAREEGDPFHGDSDSVREMDRLLLEITKQEIEKDELQRRIEFIEQKKIIESLIKNVEADKYNEIKIFFERYPRYSEYKPIIYDLIKTREEKKRNKEEHEKIATSNTPNRRTRSSGRVTKKNPRYVRGGKKSKSKKKRLVKTKRKKQKN